MYNDFQWGIASQGRISILKEYEPLQPFFLVALAQEAGCETFMDVGANVGIYSLFMSSLPKMKRIFAFEPTPAAMSEMRNNIALNGLEGRIETLNKAVSSAAGSVQFGIVSEISGANSILSTTIHEANKITKKVAVECVTIDSLAIPNDRPICCKIDVEGHELEALRGAEDLLRSSRTVMQFENYDKSDRSLFELVEGYGYRKIVNLGPDHYVTNIPQLLDDSMTIRVFENACRMLIDSNHAAPSVDQGIRFAGPAGVSLHLTGRSAGLARRFRSLVRRK